MTPPVETSVFWSLRSFTRKFAKLKRVFLQLALFLCSYFLSLNHSPNSQINPNLVHRLWARIWCSRAPFSCGPSSPTFHWLFKFLLMESPHPLPFAAPLVWNLIFRYLSRLPFPSSSNSNSHSSNFVSMDNTIPVTMVLFCLISSKPMKSESIWSRLPSWNQISSFYSMIWSFFFRFDHFLFACATIISLDWFF